VVVTSLHVDIGVCLKKHVFGNKCDFMLKFLQ
jgi:hypothetical protein